MIRRLLDHAPRFPNFRRKIHAGVWLNALALALLIPLAISPVRSQPATDWTIPNTLFLPLEWSELEGWAADDHAKAFDTFLASCKVLGARKGKPGANAKPLEAPLTQVCQAALALGPATAARSARILRNAISPRAPAPSG